MLGGLISPSGNLLPKFPTGYAGTLEKRGHWRKNWKERYFTLIPETRQLKYFSNSGQTNIKGEITLDHESTVREMEQKEFENHSHVFILKAKQNGDFVTHYLSANNDKTMRQWMQAIEETIHDGFPLVNQPELWPHSFYSNTFVICTFDHLDGNLTRKPCDQIVTLSELRRPPLVSFLVKSPTRSLSKPEELKTSSSQKSRDYYSIVMIDVNLPPSGYLCWLIMNIKDEDMYTGNEDIALTSAWLTNIYKSIGSEIVPYASPAPIYGNTHQIYFVVMHQHGQYTHSQLESYRDMFSNRFDFSLTKFVAFCSCISPNNPLQTSTSNPVGLVRYQVQWDVHCDELHQRMYYHPPKSNMSPYQKHELLKYAYHRYKLHKRFFHLTSYDQLKRWQSVNVVFRLNQRHFRRLDSFPTVVSDSPVSKIHESILSTTKTQHTRPLTGVTTTSKHSSVKTTSPTDIVYVYNGDVVDFDITDSEPNIFYSVDEEPVLGRSSSMNNVTYYMLVMLSLDYPTRSNPVQGKQYGVGFVQWLVANIPFNSISDGEEIVPYANYLCPSILHGHEESNGLGPTISTDTDVSTAPEGDYHRHIVAIYKQSRRLTVEEIYDANIDRYDLCLLPILEGFDMELEPTAFNTFITATRSAFETYMKSDQSSKKERQDRQSTYGISTDDFHQIRFIPADIDWKDSPCLPYNHPNKPAAKQPQEDEQKVVDSITTNETEADIDDMIDEEDFEGYTSPDASVSIVNIHTNIPEENHKTSEAILAALVQAPDDDFIFNHADPISEEEKAYQKGFLLGEIVRKKFSKDYVSKNRFVWLDANTQTLNWSKSAQDRNNTFKRKCIDIYGSSVSDVFVTSSKIIHIDFSSGSALDIELYTEGKEDIKVKMHSFIKLFNKIRHLKSRLIES